VDLVRIKLLNSNRARAFYNAGLTTVSSIVASDMKKLEKILRSSMQFTSENPSGANNINTLVNSKGEMVFWCEGKSYTFYEASEGRF
jgi:hypothetical protein